LDFQHLLPEGSNAKLSDDLAAHHGHPDSGAGPGQPAHSKITGAHVDCSSLPVYTPYITIYFETTTQVNTTFFKKADEALSK
jgi:hypothetical protein